MNGWTISARTQSTFTTIFQITIKFLLMIIPISVLTKKIKRRTRIKWTSKCLKISKASNYLVKAYQKRTKAKLVLEIRQLFGLLLLLRFQKVVVLSQKVSQVRAPWIQMKWSSLMPLIGNSPFKLRKLKWDKKIVLRLELQEFKTRRSKINDLRSSKRLWN